MSCVRGGHWFLFQPVLKSAEECLKLEALPSSEFLKEAPAYFHTDGKPAAFTVKVLKMRGGDPSEDELAVVRALMTEDDKKAFDSGKAMFEA